MAQVAVNVVANWVGRGTNLVLNLLFIPVYLALLGHSAYGLVGFFGALQATLVILELGLGLALIRELARCSGAAASAGRLQDVVKTVSVVFSLIGLAVMGVCLVIAGPAARHWFHPEGLDRSTVRSCLMLMGLLLALQFPASLFFSGLMGLQRQVQANAIIIILTLVRVIGAWAILVWVHPAVELFFAWHVLVHVIQAVTLRVAFDRLLPRADRPARFALASLRPLWHFSMVMAGMMMVQLLMWNADRLLLSRIFTLDVLGYYSVAASVATGLLSLGTGFAQAVFPHLSQVVKEHQIGSVVVRRRYLELSDGIHTLVVPVGVSIAGLAPAVIVAWTGDRALAVLAGPVMTMLVLATMLRTCFIMPNQLAYAAGQPGIALRLWSMFLVLYVPLGLGLSHLIGPDGFPLALVATSVGLNLAVLVAVHRCVMPTERQVWLARGLLPKLVVCAVPVVAARATWELAWSRMAHLILFLGILSITMVLALAVSPGSRKRLVRVLRRGTEVAGAEEATP